MEITPNILSYQNNSVKSQNFTSKKSLMRKLSDINMLTMREFPVHSNTRLERYQTKSNSLYMVYKYASGLVDEIRGFSKLSRDERDYVFKSLDAVKNLKVGNCSELADAAYVACKVNKIRNVRKLSMYALDTETGKIRNLDHTLIGINFDNPFASTLERREIFGRDNKAIILDPWAGFVKNEREATTLYKNDFIFGKDLSPTEKICYIENKNVKSLKDKDILYFGEKYKGISKTKKTPLEKLKWLLTDKRQFRHEKFPLNIRESYRTNIGFKKAFTSSELTTYITNNVKKAEQERRTKKMMRIKRENNKFYDLWCKIKDYTFVDF